MLVTIWEADPERSVIERRVTPANFVDWEAKTGVFEQMGVLPNWSGPSWNFNVGAPQGLERVKGIYASSGFFRVLGVGAFMGRTSDPGEDRRQGVRTVILSHSYRLS